jgi:hypothetical protein
MRTDTAPAGILADQILTKRRGVHVRASEDETRPNLTSLNVRPSLRTGTDLQRDIVVNAAAHASSSQADTEQNRRFGIPSSRYLIVTAQAFAEQTVNVPAQPIAGQTLVWTYGTTEEGADVVKWTADANERLRALVNDKPGLSVAALTYAKELIHICATAGSSEPSIDVDDDLNLEIFVKEGKSGLLFVLSGEENLYVFGNSQEEKWRARYSLSGQSWRKHARSFLSSSK